MAKFIRLIWMRILGDFDSRGFVRLVQTHLLSAAGDALVAIALAGSLFFSQDPNTARTNVAFSLLLTMAPFAVVAPFLGPVVHRVRGGRRFILFFASAGRALLCLLMATSLDSVALYPLAFGSLVLSKTHAVVKSATVPEIVQDSRRLVKANSVLAIWAVIASFVVGAVGYAFATVTSESWALRAGALLFVIAAALATEVGVKGALQKASSVASVPTAGFRLRETGVLPASVVMATLRASVGFMTFLIAFDLRRAEASMAWFGLAISGGMIGTSLGNLIGPRIRARLREENMLVLATATVVFVAILMTVFAGRYASALIALVLGMVAAAGKLAFDSIVQRETPLSHRATIFARFEASFQLVWVLGALVPVALTIGNAFGYVLLASAAAAAGGWYFVQPTRREALQHPAA